MISFSMVSVSDLSNGLAKIFTCIIEFFTLFFLLGVSAWQGMPDVSATV